MLACLLVASRERKHGDDHAEPGHALLPRCVEVIDMGTWVGQAAVGLLPWASCHPADNACDAYHDWKYAIGPRESHSERRTLPSVGDATDERIGLFWQVTRASMPTPNPKAGGMQFVDPMKGGYLPWIYQAANRGYCE